MNRLDVQSRTRLLCVLTLVLGGLVVSAQAQLTIDWHTIDGGGHTFSTAGTYSLGGTCGQPDAGAVGGGDLQLCGGFWQGGAPTSGIPDGPGDPGAPTTFRVLAGLRNPFTSETGIRLDLPTPRRVEIRVFDYSGRLVANVCEGLMPAGTHHLTWNATDRSGRQVASGVYLLQVRAGDFITRRRVVCVR